MRDPTYSLVLPIFNEEDVLPALFARLTLLLDVWTGLRRFSSSTTARRTKAGS